MGSAAIDFIKQKTGTLSDKNILIIGIGKVTELVLKYLKEERPNVVFISNRTFDKTQHLAGQIGAKAVRFDNLRQSLKEADIVITATASPHFIIKRQTLEGLINHRLLIVDLALPRDVNPEIKQFKDIELFDLEDVGSIVQRNLKKRKIEAEKVDKFIEIEVEKLWARLIRLEPEPDPLP